MPNYAPIHCLASVNIQQVFMYINEESFFFMSDAILPDYHSASICNKEKNVMDY